MEILQLIETIKQDPSCEVYPAQLAQNLPQNIPDDVKIFYREINGIKFFHKKLIQLKSSRVINLYRLILIYSQTNQPIWNWKMMISVMTGF